MEIARELTPEVPAHSHVKVVPEESTTSEAAAAKAEGAPSDDEGNDASNVVEIRATETSTASNHTKTVSRPHIRLRAALAQLWWQFSHWELVWSAPVKKCICRW